MYLVDTNVISAAAPGKPEVAAEVTAWMDRHSSILFLSVVTVMELQAGIAKLTREGSVRRAAALADWLDLLLHLYGDRVLPFDRPIARPAGELADLALGRGHAPGFADVTIAATARAHGLMILSRNFRHFRVLDVAVTDPFVRLPG